jgi:hypothetical protein
MRGSDGAVYRIEHSYPLNREKAPVMSADLEREAGR